MTHTLISVLALLVLAGPATANAMETIQRPSDGAAYGCMPPPGCSGHELPTIYDRPTPQEDCLPRNRRGYDGHAPPFAPRKSVVARHDGLSPTRSPCGYTPGPRPDSGRMDAPAIFCESCRLHSPMTTDRVALNRRCFRGYGYICGECTRRPEPVMPCRHRSHRPAAPHDDLPPALARRCRH